MAVAGAADLFPGFQMKVLMLSVYWSLLAEVCNDFVSFSDLIYYHTPPLLSSSLKGTPQECLWLSFSSPASLHQVLPWLLLSYGVHLSWGTQRLLTGDGDLFSPRGDHRWSFLGKSNK